MDAMLYRRIDRTIQNAKWKVFIDDRASLHIPGYYKKYPERGRIYTPLHNKSVAYLTIHEMILHHSDGMEILISSNDDFVLIHKLLNDYVDMCNEYMPSGVPDGDETIIYIDKAKKLLASMETVSDTVIKNRDHNSPVDTPTDSLEGLLQLIKGVQ